ncbi:Dipeptide transport system permease protein DppB, partial [Geodia barretti]
GSGDASARRGRREPHEIEEITREWGLDQPIIVQYWRFVSQAVQGNFGESMRYGEPVTELVIERLPATVELALASLLVAIVIALPIGVYSAIKHNSLWDHSGMTLALVGLSVPNFWLGIMLIFFLGGQWNLLPVAGRLTYGVDVTPVTQLMLVDALIAGDLPAFWDAFKHILLPAVTLGTSFAAIITRISRSSVLEVIRQDYITTARAKGLSERTVIWKHTLRNALITIITILGLQLGALLSGSVITETVFSWPGIGSLLIQAITTRDYKLAQGVILFFAMVYFFINLTVDLLYTWVDPRIRL